MQFVTNPADIAEVWIDPDGMAIPEEYPDTVAGSFGHLRYESGTWTYDLHYGYASCLTAVQLREIADRLDHLNKWWK